MKARSEHLAGASSADKPKSKAPVPRLPPEQRRAMILERAIEFFAEYGLTAQTRALANACGVTQRLLYRYFPSKAALLSEVYKKGILQPFQKDWIKLLKDESRPLDERLNTFYHDYFREVLTRRWLRLFLYASLADARMAPEYIRSVIMEMLETIVRVTARDQGVNLPRDPAVLHEIGWVLHGAVSHLAIRRHLYEASQGLPVERVIALHVRAFVASFPDVVAEARGQRAPSRQA
ncbi:MAG: TetR/AcrR family transcriptional regulator [Hyphomicrobiaceae bacterium]